MYTAMLVYSYGPWLRGKNEHGTWRFKNRHGKYFWPENGHRDEILLVIFQNIINFLTLCNTSHKIFFFAFRAIRTLPLLFLGNSHLLFRAEV